MNEIAAVIFDLDGVVTDTAEYHYQAWQRLADELGIPFDRVANEKFRGVGRDDCLRMLLDGAPVDNFEALATRKNNYYVDLLANITPADILPGAAELIDELKSAGVKTAIGSASKNTWTVLRGLGMTDTFDAVADGTMISHSKPDPEVFLKAAELLGVTPGLCVVIEDATAGVDAGLAAGMWTLGIGPMSRVGQAHAVAPGLAGVGWTQLRQLINDGAWTIRRPAGAQPDHHLETLFTIGNGHVAVRGTTMEGRAGEEPASFMHAVWDDMPVSRTELVNLPRWWGIDLWINGRRLGRDDTPAGVWSLDLRTGLLTRTMTWTPDDATEVELIDERFLSMDVQHIGAVRLCVKVVRGRAEIVTRSGLDIHVDNLGLRHLEPLGQTTNGNTVGLTARTRATSIELAVLAVLQTASSTTICDADGQPAVLTSDVVTAGDEWQAVKYVALASSAEVSDPGGTVAMLTARLAHPGSNGWNNLLARNQAAWQRIWDESDIRIDGDPAAQVALRYNMFQLLIAAPAIADASIGAKTLSGFGYRHHVFWDTELFMMPMFSFTQPQLARRMLGYRWQRLPGARRKAAAGGVAGARFPWESAGTGDEVCPTWVEDGADPTKVIRIWTGDLELHLNADIAYACVQYWLVSGDDAFMREQGAEMILDTATFWAGAAQLEDDGRYHFRDVMGPDEYHERVDDNAFNNAMARWHLQLAGRVLAWLDATASDDAARLRAQLGIDAAREANWQKVADAMFEPRWRDDVLEQQEGFFDLTDVDFTLARDPGRTQSMQQIYGIEGTHHTQNLKQPDVLMLAYLLPQMFTRDQFLANYRYYDPRTDHELGSSLGPSISAIIACRAGDAAAAYQHFKRAAQADLVDVRGNARDGIHGASAGGLWQAVVFGFAGLSVDEDGWHTTSALPPGWTRVSFSFRWRGERQKVDVARR
ncbi:MAG: beta-phosphoglucomutase [Propionibacteriaceae bacterium]|nr:beta-phosphoglucomutase [Propionibacteriaceae bacterium]